MKENEKFILGMKINSIEVPELVDKLKDDIDLNSKQNYISITNTEAMYFGDKSRSHFNYINNSKFSFCDGMGVKIAAFFNNINIKRYHGPDLFLDLINNGIKYNWSHYFLGGKPGVANQLKAKLKLQNKNIKILNCYSPPFRELSEEEEVEMINKINESQPNFLWVSLGLPKQEKWISKYLDKLDVNYAIGIGAAFDFHTGNIKRAPVFFQKIGLEWLYRTFFERRLIIRQIRGFKFMFKAIFNQFIK